jgi:hypothetical protein
MIVVLADSMLCVNTDECTSCTACYRPDVYAVWVIHSGEHVPDRSVTTKYSPTGQTRAIITRSSSSTAGISPTDVSISGSFEWDEDRDRPPVPAT